ncbi:MAG: twin-arginine translocase subunit TatC [Myxococcota bacterium]|nr:twin-arginine translocase subunit TatC [Myxococcota bacterium]
MTLGEHLGELRTRLLRCTIAVLILGVASLAYAKPIFGLLMRPVLDALPEQGRSLIYTSGIEEINVLMKVGMYCGIFLATPVILYQLWGFVAPGLYPTEKRFAGPFVVLGTMAFIAGAAFCYFVVLPTMFQFLLRDPEAAELDGRVHVARLKHQESLRYLANGDLPRAATLAEAAGKLSPSGSGTDAVELPRRLEGLARMVDAAQLGFGERARPVVRQVLDKRVEALDLLAAGDRPGAAASLDAAAGLLAGLAPSQAAEWGTLWRVQKQLVGAEAAVIEKDWTRPMLTMREQLSLVLLLELAFGIIFELPIVLALLAVVGVVRSSFLFKYQRHAFVVCLIAAAIITPTGDAVNLALMAGPMVLCYELGVVAVWLIEKRKKKIDPETGLVIP